jgi:hypothetical protein
MVSAAWGESPGWQNPQQQGRRAQPAPTRKTGVAKALKPGQPLRLADNRLGNQPPGQAGQRHAMARKALSKPDIVRQLAKIRRPAAGDVHKTAPAAVNRHVRQLRKHPEHVAAHGGFQIGRRQAGITDLAAKQQPMVGRAAEIIQHKMTI